MFSNSFSEIKIPEFIQDVDKQCPTFKGAILQADS